MTAFTKRLTVSEFEAALQHLPKRPTSEVEQMARAVMAEGRRLSEVAEEAGKTRQWLSQIVSRVWEAHKKFGRPPKGWVRGEYCLPVDMVPVVKALEETARTRKKENRSS